jgi:hypothetical protein
MIVIDLDAMKNQARKDVAISLIKRHVKPENHPTLGNILIPTTPIYWMTTNPKLNIKSLDGIGLPPIGTMWVGKSVVAMLKLMVKKTDEYAKSIGMTALKRFRRPVEVLTDHDYNEIIKLNATPMPLGILD